MKKIVSLLLTITMLLGTMGNLGLPVAYATEETSESSVEDVVIPLYPLAEISVSYNDSKTIRSGNTLKVSNNNGTLGDNTFKTYLFYDISKLDKASVTDAWLEIVSWQGTFNVNGTSETIQVYGIPDSKDNIDTSTITWATAPCNDTTSANNLTSDAVKLGDIAMTERETILQSTDEAFAEFVSQDTNGILGIVLIREATRNTVYSFASTANTTRQGPTIKVKGSISLDGYATTAASVSALPETTEQQRIKKAVLTWAIQDVARAYTEGLTQQAVTQLAEIGTMVDENIGADSGNRLFPEMHITIDNPYLSGLEANAATYIAKPTIYKKSWNWGKEKFPLSKNIRSEFWDRLDTLSFLLTQNTGAYSKSPEALTDILDCLEALCYYHTNGDLDTGRSEEDQNMNRFVYASYNMALLQVLTMYPDILPPSVKARWLECVEQTAAYQTDTFGTISTTIPHGGGFYANMDAAYTLMMDTAGRLLDNSDYTAAAIARSERMQDYMLGDGGWPYIGYSNEVPTYHQTNINYLTYYYMISGNTQTRDMLIASEPYYPITIEKNTLAEYSTAPYFKQYWERVDAGCIEVVANLAQSGRNRYLAQNILNAEESNGSIMGALFYNPDITQVPVEQNRMVYDRNIMGIRGHFDTFSYSVNGRDWKDDRGKPTFVGAVAIGDGAYPANGFLQNVYGGVYYTSNDFTEATKAYHLMQESEKPSSIDMEERHAPTNGYALSTDKNTGAFGSVYKLQHPVGGRYRSVIQPYTGMQSWVLLPDRVIGIVQTQFDEAGTAYGMEGVLQFGEGRGNDEAGYTVTAVDGETNTYTYGGLKAIIHDNNYGTISTDAPLYTENTIYGPVGYIKLNDTDLSTTKNYAAGTEGQKYYVAEIGESDNTPAEVTTSFENNINSMVITADNDTWYMYHNTTNTQKSITAPVDFTYTIESTTSEVKQGETVTLPAYGVILARETVSVATEITPSANLISVAYSEKLDLYVSVASDGQLYTSTDGINWFKGAKYAPSTNLGTIVSNVYYVTPDAIIWNPDLEEFVLSAGNALYRSSDGFNWSNAITPKAGTTTLTIQTLFWDGSKYWAGTTTGGQVVYANDNTLSSWTSMSLGSGTQKPVDGFAKASSGRLFAITMVNNAKTVYYTDDGTTWIDGSVSGVMPYRTTSIGYSPRLDYIFIAGGNSGSNTGSTQDAAFGKVVASTGLAEAKLQLKDPANGTHTQVDVISDFVIHNKYTSPVKVAGTDDIIAVSYTGEMYYRQLGDASDITKNRKWFAILPKTGEIANTLGLTSVIRGRDGYVAVGGNPSNHDVTGTGGVAIFIPNDYTEGYTVGKFYELEEQMPQSLCIRGKDEIVIPASGNTTSTYKFDVRDLSGNVISDASNTVTWSVTGTGVTIDNGEISVSSTATNQFAVITATDSEDANIIGQKTVRIVTTATDSITNYFAYKNGTLGNEIKTKKVLNATSATVDGEPCILLTATAHTTADNMYLDTNDSIFVSNKDMVFSFSVYPTDTMSKIRIATTSHQAIVPEISVSNLVPDKWNEIAVVIDDTTSVNTLYINGKYIANRTKAITSGIIRLAVFTNKGAGAIEGTTACIDNVTLSVGSATFPAITTTALAIDGMYINGYGSMTYSALTEALLGTNPNTTYKIYKNGTEITDFATVAEKGVHISVYTNGAFVSEYILDKTYAVVNYTGYSNDVENEKFNEGKYKSTVKVISQGKELKVMAVLAQFDIDSMVKCDVKYYTVTSVTDDAYALMEGINETEGTYLKFFLFEQGTLVPLTVHPVTINPVVPEE